MANHLSRRVRVALIASVACVAAAPAAARDEPYDATVFFGDSLTDAGFFRPLLPISVQPVTGQFLDNPGKTYAQYLADFYGTDASPNGNGQTGPNYAAGGARVGINTTGALGPIPSLQTQVNNYLASTGGVADAKTLYTVYGGANDLFAITNGGADPTTTIAGAVGSEVAIVDQLTDAGARYILVPNIPDLGVTPAFRAQGSLAQGNGTALSQSYNASLYAALNSAGLRYIPLDTFSLIREIVSDPALYGFTNYTGTACQPQITANSLTCNPTSLVTPTAGQDYVFADGVHPTSKTHAIFANYTLSVLEGPRQVALIPFLTSLSGRARADRIGMQQDRPLADGLGIWGEVEFGGQTMEDLGDGFAAKSRSFLAGVDWTKGALRAGLFAGAGRHDVDFKTFADGYTQDDVTLGLYAGMRMGGFWARGTVGHSWLSHEVDRDIVLGATTRRHSGETDGTNLFAGVQGGYEFRTEKFAHGPVLGIVAQRIRIDGYGENNPTLSTSLAFEDQSFDSLIGSVGYRAELNLVGNVRPYMQLTYDKEMGDLPDEVYARLQSMPETEAYAVPGLTPRTSYFTGQLGLRGQFGSLNANLGGTYTMGNDDGSNWGVRAGVGMKF